MYEYRKFDIVQVAELCGLSLDSRTLGRVEVEAWCPFCSTKSSSRHLFLNKDKERFICYKCSAKGNSVTLYAGVFGISNREAFERLSGYGSLAPLPELPYQPQTAVPAREVAPLLRRHDVYSDMLAAMELTGTHLQDLVERGLNAERIRQNGYRSMPESPYKRRAIAQYLAKRHDLRGVPGFYSKYGRWELYGKPGILIPVRDVDGCIQGLQIRLDRAEKKKRYCWLSSNPDYGYLYGTAANSWVHVAGERNSREAFITEGGLKGDVASYLSGELLFICTAGASSIRGLTDVIRSLGISKIFGCYDMDKLAELRELEQRRRENPFDRDAAKPCPLERMEALVRATGLPYQRCEWDVDLNGIDDYYLDSFIRQQKAG